MNGMVTEHCCYALQEAHMLHKFQQIMLLSVLHIRTQQC